MLVDAMACPPGIAYLTDLEFMNTSEEKCEEIIDKMFSPMVHGFLKP